MDSNVVQGYISSAVPNTKKRKIEETSVFKTTIDALQYDSTNDIFIPKEIKKRKTSVSVSNSKDILKYDPEYPYVESLRKNKEKINIYIPTNVPEYMPTPIAILERSKTREVNESLIDQEYNPYSPILCPELLCGEM